MKATKFKGNMQKLEGDIYNLGAYSETYHIAHRLDLDKMCLYIVMVMKNIYPLIVSPSVCCIYGA